MYGKNLAIFSKNWGIATWSSDRMYLNAEKGLTKFMFIKRGVNYKRLTRILIKEATS